MRAATRVTRLTTTALTLCVIGAGAALAQQAPSKSEAEHSQHHPQAPQAQPAPAPAPASGSATPRSGGMMGGDMGRMMQMMHGGMAAQPGGMRGGMMPRFHRVEGQLAYFRAELRITEAQTPQWNAFAEIVRAQTGRLRQGAMQEMQGQQSGTAQPVPAMQQMERRIALLSTHLEAMRAVAAAAAPLYAALSDEQRRTADELMAEHFRSMPMGMP